MRAFFTVSLVFVGFFLDQACGDVYLHMFRGSNNRLDEANRDRENGNRLFDSQNNNRGGYNVGSQFYFAGEKAYIEWTNQHGCGTNPNTHCELVFQYMCDNLLRDGTTTTTIPNTAEADKNPKYGRQESHAWYQACTVRPRNAGLFTASQNLNGNSAIYTRQNPNGERHGFECPEERDYYPYWHPTPWRDILILTDQPERNCAMYQAESQNVKGKGYCFDNTTMEPIHKVNNPAACLALKLEPNHTAVWLDVGAWNIPPPECRLAPWSRDNHLGNGVGGEPNHFTWTVPDFLHEHCALRLRYNISTADYDGWNSAINASLNDRQGVKIMTLLGAKYGITDPTTSGYLFKNNPEVDPGIATDLKFQLAINTAQYGRTFQDRSHRFAIRATPQGADSIKTLSVRGKRGNIVQVFPGVEYDFVPNTLYASTDDWIHLQWTGSNTNPANNDGEGRAGSDRSNVAEIKTYGGTYPQHLNRSRMVNSTVFHPYYLSHLLSRISMTTAGGEMSQLDDGYTYIDGGLIRFQTAGTYNYMCTRNNNFSNRSQKAAIVVSQGTSSSGFSTGALVGVIVGSVAFVALAVAAGVGTAIYMKKSAKAAKALEDEEERNPFSPMYEDDS